MNSALRPLLLLAGLLAAAPAVAQQTGTPDTGVRRQSPDSGPSATPGDTVPSVALPGGNSTRPELAKSLTDAERAAFASAVKAVDDGRYADARGMIANFKNPLLSRYLDWNILRVATRADADFGSTWRFLRENPDWPEPEVLRRQAEDRIGADTPSTEIFRYFTAFPPLTSSGHMRRLEAAEAVSPNDVKRLAGESWRNATFRAADENEFLNRYGSYLTGHDHIARFDRILRDGRPQVARDLVPKLPPDYQPLAEARLAMATKSADAPLLLKAVPAAKLDEPAIRLERFQWLRRTGNLDQAKALLLASPSSQSEAWWNERQSLARDYLAVGRAADAYAVTVPHGLTRGVAFAEAEFLAGWIALRQLKRNAEALKHFQLLYDGVGTDISKSRAAYWMGRAQEAANHRNEAKDWYGRAAQYGQTFYGQLAARKVPGAPS
ncbi:MAG: hypothetical protein JOY64_05115, partial [Alphaproteobacteria bacterium]|nr:hypothetical protein [Alphaproteobacteria bacterium]